MSNKRICTFCNEKPIAYRKHKYCLECVELAKLKYYKRVNLIRTERNAYLKSLSVDELLQHMKEEHNI